MRISTWDGLFAQTFYGLTWPTSVFLTGLALLLGASNFEIGMLAALPPLMSGTFLFAARVLDRARSRKRYYLVTAAIHRVVFFALLALPLLGHAMTKRFGVAILFGISGISIVFGNFQTTGWLSWMADMVPEERRGSFFAKRNMLCSALWMAMSYGIGKLLDAHGSLAAYAAVFAAGTALALVALLFVARQPDPQPDRPDVPTPFGRLWKEAYAEPAFRGLLLFQLVWGFTTSLAAPFYNVYMLQKLHLDLAQITIWGIIGGVVGTVTMPYWGTLGDRAGNRPTMLFCLIGSCANAFTWLFVTRSNVDWLLPVSFGMGGFFDTGLGLIGFNMLLGVLPDKNRPGYVAIYEAVVGTVMGLAPAAGGLLAERIPRVQLPWRVLDPVLAVIALSTVTRLASLGFIARLPSRQGRGFGFMMREFVLTNPFRLLPNLAFVQKSPEQKIAAIDNLSDMKSRAAVPDLIKSIHDLSPRVRERAVEALGEIGDKTALSALLTALDDPLEDIQGEAILAIGKLADPGAVPVLLKKLEGDDPHLARCAARALGDIGDPGAARSLLARFQDTSRTAVMLACADALGRLGVYETVDPLLEMTRRIDNATVKHRVVASIATLVEQKGDLYKALSEPEKYSNRAAEEILSVRTVKLARVHPPVQRSLARALSAYRRHDFNEAILEMKVISQMVVRECLADKHLKDALGFEQWVRLLDSDYPAQLRAVQRLANETAIALGIVDFYARHCPSPSEPDMDAQEFLLALYAFRAGQVGIGRLIDSPNLLGLSVMEHVQTLTDLVKI
jgi:MFS family permease